MNANRVVGSATLLLACALLTSCAARRVEGGQRDMRRTLLTLHEEQMFDNLVRLQKGLPILHVDYSSLTAEITDTMGAGTGEVGYASADNVFRRVAGAAIPATDSLTGAGTRTTNLKGTASGTMASKLSMVGLPVIGKSFVYAAYLNYLKLDAKGQQTSSYSGPNSGGTVAQLLPLEGPECSPPSPCRCIMRRQYEDGWWYIPVEYRLEFRAFGLAANDLTRDNPVPPKQRAIAVVNFARLSKAVGGDSTPTTEHAYLARLSVGVPQHDMGEIVVKLGSAGNRAVSLITLPATRGALLHTDGTTRQETDAILGMLVKDRPVTAGGGLWPEIIIKFMGDIVPQGRSADTIMSELMGLKEGVNLKIDNTSPQVPDPTEELLRSINDKLQQQLLQPR